MTRLSRRTALASLPATGLLASAPATASPATASISPSVLPTKPSSSDPVRLAFLADTHTDPENEESMERIHAVFAAVDAFDPHLVIHGGDVTEYGTEAEYRAFEDAVPESLLDRIAAVPGNHETRWDASAGQLRQEWIGEEVRYQDIDGLRIVLADTTTYQQEVAWWSPSALQELEDAVATSRGLPCVLVTHFPMGEGFYYVANQQEFEDVLVECPVSLHLTGHTHRELLTRVNRRDQLEAAAVKVDAAYYELTGSVRELVVTRVDIPDLDAPTDVVRTELTTYDLRPDRGRDRALPKKADVTLAGDSVDLDVAFTGTFSGSVDAVLYDTSIYAGRNDELAWSALERRKHRFTGQLDGSALPPGAQRVHVRVVPEDDSGNRLLTVPVARTSDPVSWRSELEGSIQGGATVVSTGDEELLVVGDSSGRVTALDDAGRARWSSRVEGEVRHDLVPIGDRSRVAVPDSAGYVHLFGPDGEPGHRYATDAPLSGDPGCGWVDDTEVLMVCAGTTLHLVETSTGDQLWTADLPAPSMGAPATDGDRVFIGAGDGRAHALDARTGSLLWSTSVTDKEGSYQRFIYGPWNDAVIVLPDGGVIISGIADARCLEPADGSVRWSLDGSFQYAREAVTEDGDLVMADEAGEIVVLDPTSGTAKARHATAERILDEGFVLSDGVVYAASHSGLISAVDLASGEIEHLARLGAAPVLAPGTVFGEDVVFGDLAGTVHAVPMI